MKFINIDICKSTMLVELILGFTISSLLWYFMTRLPPNYPPTPPIRLPILGHSHYLFWIRDSDRSSALYKMFQRYSKNDILTLHIGTERITMIGKKIYFICLCFLKAFIPTFNHFQGRTKWQRTCFQMRKPIHGLTQK